MNWSKLQDIGRMGSLASCCSPWGCKESDTTFQLDNNNCFTNCNKCTRPKRIILMFSSVAQLRPTLATPWTAAHQASLSITNSRSSLRLTSIESVMSSSHLILWRPLFLLPPIPSNIRVFSNELILHMRWPKYWSFHFSINPSKEHPGLISFKKDWLDSLAVQGTLKSLIQHHSSKHQLFSAQLLSIVQLSHWYIRINITKIFSKISINLKLE